MYLSNPKIEIKLLSSPGEADMSIVSIDEQGVPGTLNMKAFDAYGYLESDYPDFETLQSGLFFIKKAGKKPVLFIVTGVSSRVKENLIKNLEQGLYKYHEELISKTVWIGLMGLTSGLITVEESFRITFEILDRFSKEWADTHFIISVPSKSFYEEVIGRDAKVDNDVYIDIQPSIKIPGLLSDSEDGKDYLDITHDVEAFARVIANRRFDPPLAIALFGTWGSGKSFFMRKLNEKINSLSGDDAGDLYCKGIVQIHFNAWSYMDANLWASFVSQIFEGLQNYIKNNTVSEAVICNVKAELSKQLNVTRSGIEGLEEKKEMLRNQITDLKGKRNQARDDIKNKVRHIKLNTVWTVLEKVDSQFGARQRILAAVLKNKTYVNTVEELREIVPEKYLDNPTVAYEMVKSKYTFLKEFFRKKSLFNNIIWLSIILVIVGLTPYTLNLLGLNINRIDFSVIQIFLSAFLPLGFVFNRVKIVYEELRPVVEALWGVKEVYENQRQKALSEFEQQEKVLMLEIEKKKAELLLFTDQIQRAQLVLTELDYKITNALASETLYSFIEERAKSEDYKKHLGVISVVRKDFEILNALFKGHKSELVSQERVELFRKYFKRPLERIILYVDDLDRCPEENVVQVLEAVNLLMAFPLFVVIVGVDPRWVRNALLRKYQNQFVRAEINGFLEDDVRRDFIDPSNYLEKIFQIPFHLRLAKSKSVKDMVRQLAITGASLVENNSNLGDESGSQDIDVSGTLQEQFASTILHDYDKKEAEINAINSTKNTSADAGFLELSDIEIEYLQDMADIVGANPRSLKRFVNIFKVIKAHEDYTLGKDADKDELIGILLMLAIATGKYKFLLPSFGAYITDPDNKYKRIAIYLQQSGDFEKERNQLNLSLSANYSYRIIQNTASYIFDRHYHFIKRFTF